MKNELFVSFLRGYIKRKGIPLGDDIILFDSFDSTKRTKFYSDSGWRTLDYKDIPFPPKEQKYKFPPELYLVFKKKQIDFQFNYLEYGSDVKILSLDFFQELLNNGLDKNQYEYSILKLVNKDGDQLTERKYCALRFGKFDDDKFEFNKQTSVRSKVNGSTNYIYPDLVLITDSLDKNIFVLREFAYRNSFVFNNKDFVDHLITKFTDINIYTTRDFPFIYDNQYDEELVPLNNEYLITV